MQNLSPRQTKTDTLTHVIVRSSLRGKSTQSPLCHPEPVEGRQIEEKQSHYRMGVANIISGIVDHSKLHTILSILIAFLCIPLLLILDILFFQFTRPSCAACANLNEFLTHSSTTLAFIQGNKTLMDALHIYKKHV